MASTGNDVTEWSSDDATADRKSIVTGESRDTAANDRHRRNVAPVGDTVVTTVDDVSSGSNDVDHQLACTLR